MFVQSPFERGCWLSQDLQHFNDFFIEKEEECIIRTQALEEQLANAQPGTSMSKLRSAFVDLHGGAVCCTSSLINLALSDWMMS